MIGFFGNKERKQAQMYYQNQNMQQNNYDIDGALNVLKQDGNLFICLYQIKSMASGNNIFLNQIKELRDHIIASERHKKVRGIESDVSIVLYSNEPFDVEEAIIRALENTSTKDIIKNADASSLCILNINLIIDFNTGFINKTKQYLKDCSVVKVGADIRLAFGKIEVIEKGYNIALKDALNDCTIEVMRTNPSDREAFIKALLS